MSILQLFSDFLSIITISSCLVLKVPQILSIYRLKSASGINIYGLLMELGSYTTTTCYNYVNGYALLSYMEYPIIIVQEYALIFLVLKYKHLFNTRTYVLITVYFVISLGFVSKVIPSPVLMYIIPLCTPVSLSSKAIQLCEILRTRNADSVSITTVTMLQPLCTPVSLSSKAIQLCEILRTSNADSVSITTVTMLQQLLPQFHCPVKLYSCVRYSEPEMQTLSV
ncbi:solute carrier family 66 member 3 isoform X1 [Homalodisca vitripennis]|uniref:solute carrier family 66 member 3 isoform X1 n=1 Tax=Homalodisca vitripennis TaxID=197043 RepID=UPI001EEA39BE|nr:solute carrier family 66 member 3 isoform X1 [Homalodisca vitripennis]